MSTISPIRIPTTDEVVIYIANPIGEPVDTCGEWETAVYEVWSEDKIFKYVNFQLLLLNEEVGCAAEYGFYMNQEEFAQRRDIALQGILSIKDFLNEDNNRVYRQRLADLVQTVSETTKRYQEVMLK